MCYPRGGDVTATKRARTDACSRSLKGSCRAIPDASRYLSTSDWRKNLSPALALHMVSQKSVPKRCGRWRPTTFNKRSACADHNPATGNRELHMLPQHSLFGYWLHIRQHHSAAGSACLVGGQILDKRRRPPGDIGIPKNFQHGLPASDPLLLAHV
jgi:hypothetical protein